MSMTIALTGLDAASTQLETISNNIANGQTNGYKRSEVEFGDLYARSSLGAVGQGVQVTAVSQDFSQGDSTFTDNNLDLTIEGDGFFRMSRDGLATYGRDGAFGLDKEGYLVNATGSRLLGYGVNEEGLLLGVDTELRVEFADQQPTATENMSYSMNLASEDEVLGAFDAANPATYNFTTSMTVYDSLGTAQVSTTYLKKDATNSWSAYLYVDDVEVSPPGGVELGFDSEGALETVDGAPGTSFSSTTFTPASGANPMTLAVDVSQITQYDAQSGVNALTQDGYAAGRLDDFDIDNAGIIFGRYSNGEARAMGQVTLSNFANPDGLRQTGNNAWVQTGTSGEPVTGAPGSASLGAIRSGTIEGSNVDITEELVAMIGAQRSFQANAQVISTADTLSQTVMNLKR